MAEEIDHCVTHAHAHVNWKIKRFLDLPKENNYFVTSPAFPLSHSKWFLLVYPNCLHQFSEESAGWIGLYLKKDETDEECCVAFKIGITKNDGSELSSKLRGKWTFTTRNNAFGSLCCIQRIRLTEDIFAADGSLRLFCSARVVKTMDARTAKTMGKGSQTISPCVNQTLVEDLNSMYLRRQNADITIKMKDTYLEVHKCILVARSEFFASMFSHDMAENRNGEVIIGDCDPNLFETFIFYLYTGIFDKFASDNALNLFKIADMHNVKELKKECLRCMMRNLSVDSICDVKHLAEMHNESDLQNCVKKFFLAYKEQILKTPKWKAYTSEHRNTARKLLSSFYYKERRKKKLGLLRAEVKSRPNCR